MSVINQVLNDLEKRGINALPNEPAVRPVSSQRNWVKPAFLAAMLLALVFLLAMQWQNQTQPRATASPAEKAAPANTAGNSSPASATNKNTVPIPATPAAQPLAEPLPVAAAPHEIAREEDIRQEDASALPAMRMSPELSALPLPSNLLNQPLVATASQPSNSEPNLPNTADSSSTKIAAKQQQHTPAGKAEKGDIIARQPAPPPQESLGKQIKQLTTQQQADNEYLQANELLQQGRINEALAGYETALRLDPTHDAARLAAAGLLLKNKRLTEAEQILQEGLARNPAHTGFAMLLARLQVERDAVQTGLDTLLKTLPHAGQQPDYHAFTAALLQRFNRHQEAVAHYRTALQQTPDSGVWLMGLGISLQALHHKEEAREAFRRALESRTLNTELQAFVRQRLKEL